VAMWSAVIRQSFRIGPPLTARYPRGAPRAYQDPSTGMRSPADYSGPAGETAF